ncbi:MAG: hypothetical protein Q9200_001183 [Gallowayella weberi]
MAAGRDRLESATNIFKGLRTVHARDTFISSFLASIPKNHVREIVAHAASIDFHFDIIGNLPIEILSLVFQNLEIYQAFQLRRVSRQWLNTLSAPDFIEALLLPWFATETVKLRIPPNLPIEAALAVKAEHVDAFRTGNPFSMVKHKWGGSMRRYDLRHVIYHDGRVAWIDQAFHSPRVMDLELGHEISYTNPNRERSTLICLSSDILVSTTASGKCYAWALSNPSDPSSIQLLSAQVEHLSASGKSIVLIHLEDTVFGSISITTWSLEHGTTKSFNVKLQANLQPCSHHYVVHITPDWLLLLETGPLDQVFFSRYTLNGKLIAKEASGHVYGNFWLGYMNITVHPPQGVVKTLTLGEVEGLSTKKRGLRAAEHLDRLTAGKPDGIPTIVYNVCNDQLHLQHREFSLAHLTGAAKDCQHRNSYRYIWKSTVFEICSQQDDDDDTHKLCPFDTSSQTVIPDYRNLFEWDMSTRRSGDEGWNTYLMHPRRQPTWLLGDEIYRVRLYPNGFTAFCFDKNIAMANERRRVSANGEQGLEECRCRDRQKL